MKTKASGFYADSLEMLLDTMCCMLGGIVFIALMVAVVAQDQPPPSPSQFHQQSATLSRELAEVNSSNSVVAVELEHLQASPHFQTNLMHLPNITDTTKQPWSVIVRYGKLYPIYRMPAARNGRPVRNDRSIVLTPEGSFSAVAPRAEMGDNPEGGTAATAAAFKASGQTNFYFAFWVYQDSFAAFTRARETALRLGFQVGWEPLPASRSLRLGREGERIHPQD